MHVSRQGSVLLRPRASLPALLESSPRESAKNTFDDPPPYFEGQQIVLSLSSSLLPRFGRSQADGALQPRMHKTLVPAVSSSAPRLRPLASTASRHEVRIALAGFPNQPTFKIGGTHGNAVIKSRNPKVHRGWRVLAINNKELRPSEVAHALVSAQQRPRYSVVFLTDVTDTQRRVSLEEDAAWLEAQRQDQERRDRIAEEAQARARTLLKQADQQQQRDMERRRQAAVKAAAAEAVERAQEEAESSRMSKEDADSAEREACDAKRVLTEQRLKIEAEVAEWSRRVLEGAEQLRKFKEAERLKTEAAIAEEAERLRRESDDGERERRQAEEAQKSQAAEKLAEQARRQAEEIERVHRIEEEEKQRRQQDSEDQKAEWQHLQEAAAEEADRQRTRAREAQEAEWHHQHEVMNQTWSLEASAAEAIEIEAERYHMGREDANTAKRETWEAECVLPGTRLEMEAEEEEEKNEEQLKMSDATERFDVDSRKYHDEEAECLGGESEDAERMQGDAEEAQKNIVADAFAEEQARLQAEEIECGRRTEHKEQLREQAREAQRAEWRRQQEVLEQQRKQAIEAEEPKSQGRQEALEFSQSRDADAGSNDQERTSAREAQEAEWRHQQEILNLARCQEAAVAESMEIEEVN